MIKIYSFILVCILSFSVLGCTMRIEPLTSPKLESSGTTVNESYRGDRVTTEVLVRNTGYSDAYDVTVKAELYGPHGICAVQSSTKSHVDYKSTSRFYITFYNVDVPPYLRHIKYYISYRDRDGFLYSHRL